MITQTKEIYKCEYCKKLYQIKRYAERHELMCSKNPANHRPCFECSNLTKKQTSVTGEHYNGEEWERKVDCFYCPERKTFLYPPNVEHKKNFYDFGDEPNEPMPKICGFFKNAFDLTL